MKRIFLYIILAVIFCIMFACKKDLDKKSPNSPDVSDFYKTQDDLVKAVNATYAVLQAHQLYTREWIFIHDMRGDDVATGGGQLETPRAQLLIGANDPANYVTTQVWLGLYGLINRANVVLDKAPGIVVTDQETVDRLKGEAKFLRAWAYYELLSQWGGVPLYDKSANLITESKGKASKTEVYNFIVTNLKDAIDVLPLTYSGGDIGRATKGAARAELARAYMLEADYANAKTQLQAIIDSKVYTLVPHYNDNFKEETEYNSESVFEVGFKDSNGATGWGSFLGDGLNMETTLHNQEYNAISWRNAIPSNALIADYETNAANNAVVDPRFKYTFWMIGDTFNNGTTVLKSKAVRGNKSLYFGKDTLISWAKHSLMYKSDCQYCPSGLNERTIRYAEVLLMMAECQNETGEPIADVLATLNQVRDRADVQMPHYPTAKYPCTNSAEVFKAIMHEKRIELCGEEIRDIDLRRWLKNGKITLAEIQSYLPYFTENKHELIPIPQSEIDANPNISQADQNPGY